jgi:cell division cycle 2-like protein
MSSRWADTEEDLAEAARLKAEKAAKRAAKEERKRHEAAAQAAAATRTSPPPSKRQRTSSYIDDNTQIVIKEPKLLRFPNIELSSCRHVETSYERLNHIEEGSYGIVFRARDMETNEVVALKRLKLERETDGFPITSLREVTTLMAAREHPNVVKLREVVMGDTLKEFVPLSLRPNLR